ncbi:hypothetical protein BU25DRAFT_331008, partial [Macroventuria anomochaeta]
ANLINNLWQSDVQISPEQTSDWNAYLMSYRDECKKAMKGSGDDVTIREHQDIIDIANGLEKGRTKEELRQILVGCYAQKRQDDVLKRIAERSIRLAVRLVAMVDVGPISQEPNPGHTPLSWIKALLGNYFTESCSVPDTPEFGKLFHALNIRRYAGLKIKWTGTTLCVFHHVAFLRGQDSAIFPDGFLEETLRTLALLFPRNDMPTKRWLQREAKPMRESTQLYLGLLRLDRLMPQDRRVEKFKFWRDELIELKERFEQPSLTSIRQFWYDRRSRGQWYTFWIAILVVLLTIFFGLVQSIEGAMQVYKAYHPTPG